MTKLYNYCTLGEHCIEMGGDAQEILELCKEEHESIRFYSLEDIRPLI